MKLLKLLMLVICVGCTQVSHTQDDRLKMVIAKAKKVDDYHTAISATYQLLSTDTNEVSYYDSLALYYYSLGNYNSALKTCELLLEYRTSDTTLIIAARSAGALNRFDELISYAKPIIASDPKNLEWRYELSKAYFNLNQGANCEGELQILIDMPKSKTESTQVSVGEHTFQVPYYSAAYNLMGVLLANVNRVDRARGCFEESMKFAPDFPLPRKNLELLPTK